MRRMQHLTLMLAAGCAILHAQSAYLPLQEGARWTLTNPATPKTLDIEVIGRDGNGYHIRFASPFGTNEWVLEARGERYVMTKYGANGRLMDLPADTVYFDFGARAGGDWNNVIGKMSMLQKDENRAAIQQGGKGGKMIFTFERNKGFVQFGDGKNAFVLDEERSSLPGGGGVSRNNGGGGSWGPGTPSTQPNAGSKPQGWWGDTESKRTDDSEPVAHVPTPGGAASGRPSRPAPQRGAPGRVLFSITPNTFANESQGPQALLARFDQVVNTGMGFLVHNAKWDELEPKSGKYNLDGLNFNVSTAKRLGVPMAYTFRLIETVDRSMPGDLKKLRWTDPKLESRLMAALDTIVPRFQGTVKWFMLGNEIDGYFGRHPGEVREFAQLLGRAKQRIQQLDPNIKVASTLMYGGIRNLDGDLKPLNDQFDFLCFTYYPLRGDFTMKDPDIVGNDIGIMRQYANGRKVVLQEMGYPSGSANGSDQDKQARFVSNIFREMRSNSDLFEAGCFWLLADLKEDFVKALEGFYGINNSRTFHSFLQTLGMFDGNGQPKKAWGVYQQEVRR